MCWRARASVVERVFKVKEGRPNVVDLIKGDRIQLIVNTPRGQDTFFDEKAIRRGRGNCADSDHHHHCRGTRPRSREYRAMQKHQTTVYALQHLHAVTMA